MAKQLVCNTNDVPAGKMKTFPVAGETILIYHLADGFYATQQRCTHTLAPLSRGSVLEDKVVQCPLHRARFDIRTGEVLRWANFPPGIQLLNVARGEKALKTYTVTVEDGQVFVEV